MARGDWERTGREGVECPFSAGPTLGLGLCARTLPDAATLARRAEEAGFGSLWVPPDALAPVAEATRAIPVVACVEVALSPDIEVCLPDPAELEAGLSGRLSGRLMVSVRFIDPPEAVRLTSRACRRIGAAIMRKVHAVTMKTDTPVLIQGSCHESLEWIAEQAEAWAYDRARLACVPTLLGEWRRVAGDKPFIQMLPDGPGLEDRVAALMRDGVDHVLVTLGSGDGSPALWGLPATLNLRYSPA